ncbi:ribonuclease D [Actinorhabdospora filicis]|uniref:Ribonuclease D n=1 Tax=Actinorhabdospora filicis TaxID=1785913 RepID=A0A9W6SPS9_9ACTN|nr:HRDC domain-containing protein [Actinorhabdospora filicis]GLZ80133.1 ribonuclease D [Actinorhabdospora filicis]
MTDQPPTTGDTAAAVADPVLLTEPREGVPDTIDTAPALARAVEAVAAGSGPVAIDAERASGYRYSARAYLIQLRREGAGTILIDPLPFADLRTLGAALDGVEWILHAASQDLPCLAELALRPTTLFDTELGARLAGFERVGLAAITERLLGYTLEKHHSAADWSTRPLPDSWLTYAALDVELLIDLKDALAAELDAQGKSDWAAQEFAALTTADFTIVRNDPWRRTSGIHKVRGARALARVRSMWQARDELASRRDLAPSKVIVDAAIVAAAQADPKTERDLTGIPGFRGRFGRSHARLWLRALAKARELPDAELPRTSPAHDGPPPAHRWSERDPVAAARLARARAAVTEVAEAHNLPTENLISPAVVRALCWTPPAELDGASMRTALAEHGAREWQMTLLADRLAEAMSG